MIMNMSRKGASILGFLQALKMIDLQLYCVFFCYTASRGATAICVLLPVGGRARFWRREAPSFADGCLLLVPPQGDGERERVSSLMTSFPPQGPASITLGVRMLTYEFGEDKRQSGAGVPRAEPGGLWAGKVCRAGRAGPVWANGNARRGAGKLGVGERSFESP